MTKEQEEAIERLNKLKSRNILYGNRAGMIIEDFKTLQNDIETVLNMLKEKNKETERLRYIKKSFDYVVQKETEKKDKINKLLIDFIYRMSIKRPGTIMYDLKEDGFDTSQCGNCKDKSCKDCIKQYFERKVRDERN